MNEKRVKCGLADSGSGYAEEARWSPNAKELPSCTNGVLAFSPHEQQTQLKKWVIKAGTCYV